MTNGPSPEELLKVYCPVCHLKWSYAGCEPGACRFKQCPSCGAGLAPGREYPGVAIHAEMEALLRASGMAERPCKFGVPCAMAALREADELTPMRTCSNCATKALLARIDAAADAGKAKGD